MTAKNTNDAAAMVLDPETIATLQSIFDCSCRRDIAPAREEGFSKTASVKFMITMQDEKDLGCLGYSQTQIAKMKPQEARDLLLSGAKAVQDFP